MANAYGVSKTLVREALLSLARWGLVDLDAFRGARVRNFTVDDVREIYEVRALMEPFALEKAVPRSDENDRDLLFSMLDDDAAAEKEDLYELSRLNRDFHNALIAECRNGRIIETMNRLQDQLRAIAVRVWALKPTYLRETEQHRKMAEAVVSGDAALAAEVMRKHVTEFEEQFVRVLELEPAGWETGKIKRR